METHQHCNKGSYQIHYYFSHCLVFSMLTDKPKSDDTFWYLVVATFAPVLVSDTNTTSVPNQHTDTFLVYLPSLAEGMYEFVAPVSPRVVAT